jgi:hypothetical protein
VDIGSPTSVQLYTGKVVQQLVQRWDNGSVTGSLITRLWAGADELEVEWVVKPLSGSREVTCQWRTSLATGKWQWWQHAIQSGAGRHMMWDTCIESCDRVTCRQEWVFVACMSRQHLRDWC